MRTSGCGGMHFKHHAGSYGALEEISLGCACDVELRLEWVPLFNNQQVSDTAITLQPMIHMPDDPYAR
jgi:hypothetical protein